MDSEPVLRSSDRIKGCRKEGCENLYSTATIRSSADRGPSIHKQESYILLLSIVVSDVAEAELLIVSPLYLFGGRVFPRCMWFWCPGAYLVPKSFGLEL